MRYIPLFFLLHIALSSVGQTIHKMGEEALIFGCSGILQDSGGNTDDYQANEDLLTVICADDTRGTHIQLTFSGVDIQAGDALCFYDGNSTAAPTLSCSGDYFNGYPFVIQATAANTSGCLTVTFKSNSTEQGAGWSALIECIAACQLIQVALESTDPISVPLDTGWIDVCIGERIQFEGKGIYPQSGLVYDHSDATSTFDWDFGDGISAQGPSVSHAYSESGGYKVQLLITDQFGCSSSNFITQRVRVSTKPVFEIQNNFPEEVCVFDTVQLNGGITAESEAANIVVSTTEGIFQAKGIRSDSLALPDGNGRSYETSISFTDFLPGQVLTNVQDLKAICLNMEHSWLHDMEISITCPNGKTVELQEQVLINDEVFLGIPDDEDGINPKAGKGKDYCWTPTATYGSLTDVANRENDSGIGEPYFLEGGEFNSHESLANLVGCPLNGEWTLTVTDLWEQDNGWIFSWGIEFDPSLFPTLETYQPQIIDFQWQDHPTTVQQTPADRPKEIIVVPNTPGMVSYLFETTDNYGCQNDTSIQIKVLPSEHPDCLKCETTLFSYNEATICEGDQLDLEAYIKPSALGAITFSNQPNYEFGNGNHPPSTPYFSPIEVSSVNATEISPSLDEIVSVCVDIESDFNADITLLLRGPKGQVINLSKENGGFSDDYRQTCFSPKATQSIETGTGPFEGIYLPEDSWEGLVGESVNGEWVLLASDKNVPTEFNLLKNWSISFKGATTGTFTWSPGTNISATVGTNPILTANADTAPFYVLEKENTNGCISIDTLLINVIKADIVIDVEYYNLRAGEVLFYWQPTPGASAYEISRDGVNWKETDDEFFHRESGFLNGESVSFSFRAIFSEQNCRTNPTELFVNYLFCDLKATLANNPIPDVQCFGGSDATAVITASGGVAPYEFLLNDSIKQTNGTFSNLSAGSYELLVNDSEGICADTIHFLIGAPDSLGVRFDSTKISCYNIEDGQITATPFGGVGGFRNIQWTPNVGDDLVIDNLKEGTYIFKATDANGCPVLDTATITAPPVLELTATQNLVTCFGGTDGEAGVKVIGGTPPYSYLWNTNQTNATTTGLGIGTYQVTVTDNNNCVEEMETTITQPEKIDVDFETTSISCIGERDAQIVATARGGIPPYQYNWEEGKTGKLNFNLGEGSYPITIQDAKGCTETFIETITPTQALIVTPSFTAPLCPSDASGTASVTVIGGTPPYQYVWDDPRGQTTQEATNLVAEKYTVTITDASSCEHIETIKVADSNAIEVFPSGQNASCHDRADGSAKIIAQGGVGGYSYLWEDGQTRQEITNLLPGKYAFTITDENNCSILDTVEVESPDTLIIDSLILIPPACNGNENGAVEAVITGGSMPYSIIWNNDQQQNPLQGVTTGFYSVAITDSKGCSINQNNILLEEPSPINLTTATIDVQCFGESSGQASAIPIGGTPPYSYRWSDAKNQNDSTALDLSQGNYTVTIEDANGCLETAEAIINQPNEALTIQIDQTIIGCAMAEESAAQVVVSGGTGSSYQYSWSDDKGNQVNGNQLEAKTYFVTVSDENNCEQTASIDITELDTIEVEILSKAPSCHNTLDGRLAISTISGGAGEGMLDNYSFSWNNNTNHPILENIIGDTTYSLTITDQQNCSTVIEKYLSSPEEVSIDFVKMDVACANDSTGSFRINATSDGSDILEYSWSNGIALSDANQASNLTPGNYRVTATTDKGCGIVTLFEITEPTPISIESSMVMPNACNNDLSGGIQLEVIGGAGTYTYAWSNGATVEDLANIPSGNYTLTITDANACSIVQNFELGSPDNLTVAINTQNIACFGDKNGRIELQPTGGVPPYQYSLDGTNYKGSNQFIGLAAGAYSVYIKDVNDCIWQEDRIFIEDAAPFKVAISSQIDNLVLGDSTIVIATFENNTGAIQFNWTASIPESFACIKEKCERITVKPQTSTKFEVYAVDEAGCEAEADLFLRVSNPKKVFVPTGFTPNNDGFNDILLTHGQSDIKVRYFRIFDRWGEEVFAATDFFLNDPAIGWDGTFRGTPLNGGIYTWIMEVEYIDLQKDIFRGSTTVLR